MDCGILLMVKRSGDPKDFVGLPRRWVVERTFDRLMNDRRLRRNDECRTETSEALVKIAMIHHHAAKTRIMTAPALRVREWSRTKSRHEQKQVFSRINEDRSCLFWHLVLQ